MLNLNEKNNKVVLLHYNIVIPYRTKQNPPLRKKEKRKKEMFHN